MSGFEILTLVIAGLSALVAIISAVYASKANRFANASVELSLYNTINSTKEKIMDCTESMEELLAKKNLTADEKRLLDLKQKRFNVAIENNLNAYEEACAKYRDGKIDRKRFRKMYSAEIHKIINDKNLSKYYDDVKSKYQATIEVYKEWFHLETK